MNVYEKIKELGIDIGDKIKVNEFVGYLMPKTEFSEKDVIILKLENGYNVGIKIDENTKIKLIEKRKEIEKVEKEVRYDSSKPKVLIIGCGGTIASRVEYRTGAVYPLIEPYELIETIPEISEIANIHVKKLFDIFSENMEPKHWKIIAEEIAKNVENYDGIVILHGTDTMHYTSAALSFMLQNLPIPIVLVGAQRSSDRPSSDSKLNLLSAIYFAAYGEIAEVVVCMHENLNDEFCAIHRGTKVRKMHTSRRDAFQSINIRPLARVNFYQRKIEYLTENFKKRNRNNKLIADISLNENVGLFYFHPGAKVEAFEEFAKHYDGIVIAASGLGHISEKFFESIKKLIESGKPIVFAPQTIYGRLDLDVYSTGRILQKIGIIGNHTDMTPETALVKLMYVLAKTKNLKEIKELMEKNLVGEISERIEV
ncbi:MAG: Glu-tRNA(Gln) amidotransferase subunit GatD [Candidatus Aenigmatarchaeota archaeon]